ncbi:hypothetical protein EWI61_07345 [Methylolobus aquaticus]|nr:hypothetical protein EWI61_07345 [Methylolobus aquaticus]
MKQLSLVACYGVKTTPLAGLLLRCRESIQQSPLRPFFRPYALEQIHGTVVGMECLDAEGALINANLLARTGQRTAMRFDPLLATLDRHLPLSIRFGGFAAGATPFLSAGRTPYERTFQVQWSSRRCTLIGWPHRGGDFVSHRALHALRDELERVCGIAHKYPDDNDFFMVLGTLELPENLAWAASDELEHTAAMLETQIRDLLSAEPFELVISRSDVRIVAYEDVTLCPDSTTAFELRPDTVTEEWFQQIRR